MPRQAKHEEAAADLGSPAWWSAWMCEIHTAFRFRSTSSAPAGT